MKLVEWVVKEMVLKIDPKNNEIEIGYVWLPFLLLWFVKGLMLLIIDVIKIF